MEDNNNTTGKNSVKIVKKDTNNDSPKPTLGSSNNNGGNKQNTDNLKPTSNNSNSNYSSTSSGSSSSSSDNNTVKFIGGKQGKAGEQETKDAYDITNKIADMVEATGDFKLSNQIKNINKRYKDNLLNAQQNAISSGVENYQKIFTQKSLLNFAGNNFDNNEALSMDNALNNSVNDLIKKSGQNKASLSKAVNDYGETVGELVQSPQVADLLGQALKKNYGLSKKDYASYENAYDDLAETFSKENFGLLYDEGDYKEKGLINDAWKDAFIDNKAQKYHDKSGFGQFMSDAVSAINVGLDSTEALLAEIWGGTVGQLFGGHFKWAKNRSQAFYKNVSDLKGSNKAAENAKSNPFIIYDEDTMHGGSGSGSKYKSHGDLYTDDNYKYNKDSTLADLPTIIKNIPITNNESGSNVLDSYNQAREDNIDKFNSDNILNNNTILESTNSIDSTIEDFSNKLSSSLIDTYNEKMNNSQTIQTRDTDDNARQINKKVKESIEDNYYDEFVAKTGELTNGLTIGNKHIENTYEDKRQAINNIDSIYPAWEPSSQSADVAKVLGNALDISPSEIYMDILRASDTSDNQQTII